MKLYILRHAIAEERDEDLYPDDSLRPLAPKGKRKMAKMAEQLEDMDIQIDLIVSSPYVRAYETAKIVRKAFELNKNELALSDHLAPSGIAKDLINEINEIYPVGHLMLVGHQPYLSDLITILVAGNPSMSVILKKGGICSLSIDRLAYEKCATLEWLLTPAQLIRMSN